MATAIAIHINVEGRNDTAENVSQVPSDITWQDFELLLKLTYDLDDIQVTYLDEENDHVTISSDPELREALRVASQNENSLSITIIAKVSSSSQLVCDSSEQADAVAVTVTVPKINTTSSAGAASEVTMEDMEDKREKSSEAKSAVACGASGSDRPTNEPVKEPKYFFVRSAVKRLVLDVKGWGRASETPLILFPQKSGGKGAPPLTNAANQLFFEDKDTGTIRNKFNKLCLDIDSDKAVMSQFDASKNSQQWMVNGNKIQHRFNNNWVLTVRNPTLWQTQSPLFASSYDRSELQHWTIAYITEDGQCIISGETGEPTYSKLSYLKDRWERPSRKMKAKAKDYYQRLAEDVGRLSKESRLKTYKGSVKRPHECTCQESGEISSLVFNEGQPPVWFHENMEQFKRDLSEEISNEVTKKVVPMIIKQLDGAVITSIHGTSGLSHDGEKKQTHCHIGVICDHCDRVIVGIRYKCGNCEDFDLCEECESVDGVHDPDHVFLKIRRPALTAGRKKNGKLVPLVKRNLYCDDEDSMDGIDVRNGEKMRKFFEKQKRKEEKMKLKEAKMEEKMRRKEEKLKRRYVEHDKQSPIKKERLDLPQFRTAERMDSEFIRDENLPDGTHIQPGTKLVKKWVIRNTGTHKWTGVTKLSMLWGNIAPVNPDVLVPELQPGEQGTVTVELMAPGESGSYQSHWRLQHNGLRFGHRVWCSIIVDPKEILEIETVKTELETLKLKSEDVEEDGDGQLNNTTEMKTTEREENHCREENCLEDSGIEKEFTTDLTCAAAAVAQLKSPNSLVTTRVIDADILTAQDILSFEMLDIRDRHTPKVSQTATPTNTPLDITPPKTPQNELEFLPLSSSSSVEIVSEERSPEQNHANMSELVQERMASLGMKPDHDDFEDIETLSTCTEDSNDSDDFYIVPLPNCFDLSKSTSGSFDKVSVSERSIDSILTASSEIDTVPLIPSTGERELFESVTVDISFDEESLDNFHDAPTEDEKLLAQDYKTEPTIEIEYYEDVSEDLENGKACVRSISNESVTSEGEEILKLDEVLEKAEDEDREEVTGAMGGEDLTDVATTGEVDAINQPAELTEEESPKGDEESPKGDEEVQTNDEPIQSQPKPIPRRKHSNGSKPGSQGSSPQEYATNVLNMAGHVVSTAATAAFSTAKDVFQTLQARNQYVPPKSEWKPSAPTWTPTQQEWVPPKQDFVPPKPWEPKEEVAKPVTLTPMDQLVEMGFANRDTNKRLLEKHDNDVQKVVQDLIQNQDCEWLMNRH